MNCSEDTILRLKQEIPLHLIAGSRMNLNRNGNEWIGLCPFHSEKTASFTIRKEDGIELFHCFGCKKSGNVFQFLMELDRITFNEAVKKVAEIGQWNLDKQEVEKTFKPAIDNKPKIVFSVDKLLPAENALSNSQEAKKWLDSRGISLETARKLHLGFVQNCSAVNNKHPWVNDGWILFPSIEGDKITLLKYRSIKGKKTADGVSGILRKDGMATPLYNMNTITAGEDLFIVEGEPDVLVMEQSGFHAIGLPNAGYSPTPEARDKIVKVKNVYLAGDMDTPGRDTMKKLWNELPGNVYLVEWPEGCKDANDCLLKTCGGDTTKFKVVIEKLMNKAKSTPMPGFYSMSEVISRADNTNPMESPDRLHFPWNDVDRMAICRPGSVVTSFATQTGTGKTTFWLAVQLHEAIKHGSVIINYSAELSPQELADLTTAILTKHSRLELTSVQREIAADMLRDSRFYIGYNPDISSIRDVLGDGTDKHPGIMEKAIRRFGARIVVLDHLHFFTSGEKEATSMEAAAMTRVKNLAVKYNLIFIVVGQARKANQSSARGRVSDISDAKGSESFTSTANTTYQLHREQKTDIEENNPPEDLLEPLTSVRLYKCRTKGPGKAYAQLYFQGITGRFEEVIPEPTVL